MKRAIVLMYHQVGTPLSEQERRFCVSPRAFRSQMRWLIDAGYKTVGIEDLLHHVSGKGSLPKKAVHVTFDDGFIGVLEHALPTLQDLRIPATLFALSACAGKTNDWMWRRGFPRRALISRQQLRLLDDEGVTIGSHTRTHVRLAEVSPEVAENEITNSKKELEDILGKEVAHFAYPYGSFNPNVRDLVIGAGYRSAYSTRSGFNRPGEDCFLLKRLDVSGRDKLWQFRQKLCLGMNEATRFRPLFYFAGRAMARLRGK